MHISIIIPNFNGKALLRKNLPKVTDAYPNCEIIVVDDASTDDSVSYVRDTFPQIVVVEKKKNEGFASSVNLGVKYAKSDFIFLLNSDCYPEKNSIEKVVTSFTDENLFAVGFAQKSPEEKKTVIRGRGTGKFEKGFFLHGYGNPNTKNTQWVSGGAGIFRKSVWEKLGGMDEIYNPFYWEDIDLSYRALKAGYSIRFDPDAFVVHDQGKGSIRSHYSPSYVQIISYRNQILFVWLNVSDPSLILSHLFYLLYYFFRSLVTFQWSFIKGYFLAEIKIVEIIRKRIIRSKMWKRRDRECLVKV